MGFLRDRIALIPVQALRAVHKYLARAGSSCEGAARPPGLPPSPHAALVHAVQQKHASDPWLQVSDRRRFLGLHDGYPCCSGSQGTCRLLMSICTSGPGNVLVNDLNASWHEGREHELSDKVCVPVHIVADYMAFLSRWYAFQARGQP